MAKQTKLEKIVERGISKCKKRHATLAFPCIWCGSADSCKTLSKKPCKLTAKQIIAELNGDVE